MTSSVPYGWLRCDNTVYSASDYPILWDRLPSVFKNTTDNTFIIDLREVTLKGIGLTRMYSNHINSTGLSLGEYINDRLEIGESSNLAIKVDTFSLAPGSVKISAGNNINNDAVYFKARGGNTTEVKSVGVNWVIKAL